MPDTLRRRGEDPHRWDLDAQRIRVFGGQRRDGFLRFTDAMNGMEGVPTHIRIFSMNGGCFCAEKQVSCLTLQHPLRIVSSPTCSAAERRGSRVDAARRPCSAVEHQSGLERKNCQGPAVRQTYDARSPDA